MVRAPASRSAGRGPASLGWHDEQWTSSTACCWSPPGSPAASSPRSSAAPRSSPSRRCSLPGLPPVMATATNTAALTPGLFLAAIYDRSQLPPFDRSFGGGGARLDRGSADRRRVAAADPGTGVLGAGAAAARVRDRAVRLCRADQHVARRPRRHPRQRAPLHPFPGGGAAGLDLWRLFRRRPRGADARRAFGRDRRQLSLRQRHQEPGDRVEQRDRHRDLRGPRGAVVAGDAADDGGNAGGRSHRRAGGASDAEPCRAQARRCSSARC